MDQLLYKMKCTSCINGHTTELKKYCNGTMLSVDVLCACGNWVVNGERNLSLAGNQSKIC